MILIYECKLCNFICNAIHFQQNFNNWTSGNNDIDKFIQDTQLSSHKDMKKALEWISYNRLYNIRHITDNSYIANWIDGNTCYWNNVDHDWKRQTQYMTVELKKLSNTKSIALEFKDEVRIFFFLLNFDKFIIFY
jgi:hypothetical protein